jgi:hypothetical protein
VWTQVQHAVCQKKISESLIEPGSVGLLRIEHVEARIQPRGMLIFIMKVSAKEFVWGHDDISCAVSGRWRAVFIDNLRIDSRIPQVCGEMLRELAHEKMTSRTGEYSAFGKGKVTLSRIRRGG